MNAQSLIDMFSAMADAIELKKDRLCELDGVIGDADHGITMSLGFTAIRSALAQTDSATATPTEIFNTAASSFLNAVGASAGPLYATAFMRAGASVKGRTELDKQSLADAIIAMADGIQFRGKAERGDKTMLDAWLPAADTARVTADDASVPIAEMMQKIAAAAVAGSKESIDMLAKKGRSAKLGERSIGHMDAGAASTAVLLTAMADHIAT